LNLWNDIKVGPASLTKVIYAVIEIPMGSKNKYEYNRELEAFILDNVADTFYYPVDYGIIPKTLGDDGNPINILVMMGQPTFPGCVIETRPIGVLKMKTSGENDYKILGVPVNDPFYEKTRGIGDIPKARLNEYEIFISKFKKSDCQIMEIGWEDTKEALRIIKLSMELYNKRSSFRSLFLLD
jgi:inorganic pyrophosphatase